MKPSLDRTLVAAIAAACLVAMPVPGASAHDHTKAEKAKSAQPAGHVEAAHAAHADAQQQAAMEAMMKLGQPGPQHDRLKAAAGKWKATVKSWNGPGEPTVSEGASDNQLILGGRCLEQRFTSTMMDQPFEGYGLNGYDNQAKRYWFIWVDNMSTGMMSGWGDLDASGRNLTSTSTTTGPDGQPMNVRSVTSFVDDDTQVFTMYGTMGGQEMKMMEITYTRR